MFFSIIVLFFSYFRKDDLPSQKDILNDLYKNPIQKETNKDPFKIKQNNITYSINPIYDYELYGLVVSHHDSDYWFDYYHNKWSDFINIKDLCVIWGKNIETGVYEKMRFKSGSFTCYPSFLENIDPSWYSKFDWSFGSNNHLLSENDKIRKIIKSVGTGDQIYFKGYLAEYSHDKGFSRGTSTTREDVENNSCETIYITDFKIFKKANFYWNLAFSVSKYLAISSIVFLTIIFFFAKDKF